MRRRWIDRLLTLMSFLAGQGKLSRVEWRALLDAAEASNMSAPILAGRTESDREAVQRAWDAERIFFAERMRTLGRHWGLNE